VREIVSRNGRIPDLSNMRRKLDLLLRNEFFGGLIIVLIFFLLVLTSCASNQDLTRAALVNYSSSAQAEATNTTDTMNGKIVQKSLEATKKYSSGDYQIGPEDLLEIDVFQVPELKTTARVSARGYISLHLINEIKAAGLTVSELESLLAKKLQKYVQEPAVSVFVKEYRSQQISVLGAVKNPQVYYVTGQKYLLDMLSAAGGLSQEAGSVCIIQTMSNDSPAEKIVIDLDGLLINGRAQLNIPVHAGDVIQVPKRGIFFVTGAVGQKGEFPLQSRTTLTQALSMAKGLNYEASHSDVKIYRDIGKPEREIITVDYDAILEGKALDSDIKDKDIIIVSSSAIKNFIKGIGGAINFGAFSLRGY
jgi:polysaccharide export outer membrane protein